MAKSGQSPKVIPNCAALFVSCLPRLLMAGQPGVTGSQCDTQLTETPALTPVELRHPGRADVASPAPRWISGAEKLYHRARNK